MSLYRPVRVGWLRHMHDFSEIDGRSGAALAVGEPSANPSGVCSLVVDHLGSGRYEEHQGRRGVPSAEQEGQQIISEISGSEGATGLDAAGVLAAVTASLFGVRFRYRDEAELHLALSERLTQASIPHRREVLVPGGRIDFLIGRVGMEVKIKGPAAQVQRQLETYAASGRFDHLILLTTRPVHRSVPRILHGVPVTVHTVGALSS